MLHDFDEINDILNAMADEGMVEPLIEPIDSSAETVDFWDWADIIGIVDEFVPNDPFWATIN